MRPEKPTEKQQRRSRFETFEERLAMSAQPLGAIQSDALDEIALEHHYGELAPLPAAGLPAFMVEHVHSQGNAGAAAEAFGAADTMTGLNGVRGTYGLNGRGQTVAIIDSGIAYDHVALGGGFGAGSRVVGGWDFAENDANPYDDAPAGFHGTHVAGIVGSSDATYRGVASGVDLVALRVFDDRGRGNFSWVEQSLQWVYDHRFDFANPITTVNLSLGTAWNSDAPPNWTTLEDEFAKLKEAGIFISVSAGNSFTTYNQAGLSYPAASSYVVPVASVDNNGQLSSFSQRNSRVIAAPGRAVVSTVPDFVTGGNGVANDFATASGTSMAAPYMAGAATLVRQAMEIVGYSNITQDTIYNHIRNTADTVYDAITNAHYFRLNVGAAINALIPTDDYGDNASTAYAIGTLNDDRALSGLIGTLQDQDYFTFTAGHSGTASVKVTGKFELESDVVLVGGGGTLSDGTLSFKVVAGQQYTVALATRAGIGTYDAAFTLERAAEVAVSELGAIDFLRVADQQVQGESQYVFTAGRRGLLTVEAAFAHQAGNVDLELYDSQNRLVAASRTAGNSERIDVTARQGEAYRLKVIGVNADVDLRLTNLITVDGSRVTVNGTSSDDSFLLRAGVNHEVQVNGVTYSFSASSVRQIQVQGGNGNDSIQMLGSSANETATLRPENALLRSTTYQFQASDVEQVQVHGGGGRDTVYLYDSAGNDRLEAHPSSVVLRAEDGSFANRADDFDFTYAYAKSGRDQAYFYDSQGNDRFDASSVYALMQSTGKFYNYASGFDACYAYATAGRDTAHFYDSRGDDHFIGAPNSGSMTDSRGTYANYGEGFDYVYGYSRSGGKDTAVLHDSAGNDIFASMAQAAQMRGAANQYSTYVAGFHNIEVRAIHGGTDTALIQASGSGHKVTGTGNELTVARSNGKSLLVGFDKITASAVGRVAATADVRAVDYIFQKIGKWK